MKRIEVGILGSTGIVGQEFVRMLAGHPWFETAALAASPGGAGRRYSEAAGWMLTRSCPAAAARMRLCAPTAEAMAARGVRLIFSALPSETAGELERELAADGFRVFTNAGANRMRPGVPVVVPEVNPDHLALIDPPESEKGGFITANPNCSTTGLVLALRPVVPFGIRSLQVTTCQALSGAGRPGPAALAMADNIIPHIPDEEAKMERETTRILGRLSAGRIRPAGIDVTATCCRVPVRSGHLEAVTLELDHPATRDEVGDALRNFRGEPQRLRLPTAPRRPILLREEIDRPQPARDRLAGSPPRARGMAVNVGRLDVRGRRLRFVLLVHNTIRGAAGGSLLNAELAFARGRLSLPGS